jgi:neutral ceramidase
MLTVGAASTVIDPPLPNDPQGYVRRSTSVMAHGDPLLITAVIFETPQSAAAILAADLAGFDVDAAMAIREAVAAAIPVPYSHVLINASHSHAAPWARFDGMKLGGGNDAMTEAEKAYVARLPHDFATAALLAWNARRPARVAGGIGQVEGLAVNRRERTSDGSTILGWNPDLSIDEDTPTIRIDDLHGDPIATITSFGCHPVVVGPDVAMTGTDFIGPLRRAVEEIRGGTCIFLQGAAGNVLPLEAFHDHDGPQEPMGRRLGLEAAHAIADSDPLERTIERLNFGSVTPISLYRRTIQDPQPTQELRVRSKVLELPLLAPPTHEELLQELAEREKALQLASDSGEDRSVTNPIRYHLNWLRSMLAHADLSGWRTTTGEVWAMSIGNCAIVGTPGEVFSEIGAEVRARSPFPTTLFAGYCQGILGYMATAAEYPFGGYEPSVAQRGYGHPAPFDPAIEAIMIDTCLSLLHALQNDST